MKTYQNRTKLNELEQLGLEQIAKKFLNCCYLEPMITKTLDVTIDNVYFNEFRYNKKGFVSDGLNFELNFFLDEFRCHACMIECNESYIIFRFRYNNKGLICIDLMEVPEGQKYDTMIKMICNIINPSEWQLDNISK